MQMYLRDDGRTRDGEVVIPDDPAAAPQAAAVEASAPGGVYNASLPIAPLHLWRDFTSASISTPVSASGTPYPWTTSASESAPARWQDFMPKQSSTSLALRQAPSSGGTKDNGKKKEAEKEGNSQTANMKVSWRKR